MNLTVLMSVFNGDSYLDCAIQSILNQTYKDFDFLIINNGSIDKTESILDHYAKVDNRIKIIKNTNNIPLIEARHQGMLLSNAEWVALMDADDYAYPQRLERQMKFLKKEGSKIGALGTYAYYMNQKNELIGVLKTGPITENQFDQVLHQNEALVIIDPSAIIHRQSYLDIGGYRSEYTPAGDLDLWYRLCEYGKQVRTIPEFLMRYRIHDESISCSKTMVQRMKTHFINHNMRRRRKGLNERTYSEFESYINKKPLSRIKWFISDSGMTYFKRAGNLFGKGKYAAFSFFLVISLILKPNYLFSKLLPQINYHLAYKFGLKKLTDKFNNLVKKSKSTFSS